MFTYSVGLELNTVTKTGKIVDNTDYSVLDFNTITVLGTAAVTGPDGTLIATVTVDISGGDTESASFNLPLDNNGEILNGGYAFTYSVQFDVNNAPVDQITSVGGLNRIWIDLEDWTDVLSAGNTVTVAGASNPGNNGAKTVVSSSLLGGQTVIVVSDTLTTEGSGANLTFSVTQTTTDSYTYTGCDAVTPIAAVTFDCESTRFGQIIFQDTTVLPAGQVRTSRTWSIAYPTNLTNPATPPNVTSSAASVTINTLATGEWTYRLTYGVTVTQADGLVYTYVQSSGSIPVNVSCAGTLCGLVCCIKTIYIKHAQAIAAGANRSGLEKQIQLLPGYYMIAKEAKTCGDESTYQEYFEKMKNLIDSSGVCDSSCGCDGEEGNVWIDNGGDEFGGCCELIFAGASAYGSQEPQPLSILNNLEIPAKYFQFASELESLGLTFSKKVVDIELTVWNPGSDSATFAMTSEGDVVVPVATFDTDFYSDIKIRIGTQRVGNDTRFIYQVVNTIYDPPSQALSAGSGAYGYSYDNQINTTGSLTLNFNIVNSGPQADVSIRNLTITPKTVV